MKKLLLVSAVLLGAVSASQAAVNISIGFGLPFPPPVIIGRPAAAVVVPAPPPACAPIAPVVVAPPCAAVVPAPVVLVPPRIYYPYYPHRHVYYPYYGRDRFHGYRY